MRIRSAIPDDLAACLEMRRMVILSGAGALYSPSQIEAWAANLSSAMYRDTIAGGQLIVAEAEQRGGLLGFAQFDPKEGMIRTLCVAVQHQGEGVGRQLVRECLLRARRLRLSRVSAIAPRDTVEFYERLDFGTGLRTSMHLENGTEVEHVSMARPVELPSIRDWIEALQESVRFFRPGQENQRAQERHVVEGLLTGLGVSFASEEVTQDIDPPDARFRTANFEVKELYPEGRRRHTEYKQDLARAQEAFFTSEMVTYHTPTDIALDTLIEQVTEVAKRYRQQYSGGQRAQLDLLVYANLSDVWSIAPTPIPDLSDLEHLGWRSVSFFRGAVTSCVLTATDLAPDFLKNAKGLLRHGYEN